MTNLLLLSLAPIGFWIVLTQRLLRDGVEPLCQMVELANLSSMIGNVLGAEVAKAEQRPLCSQWTAQVSRSASLTQQRDFFGHRN
ncbi:hypothetical protein [Novosphingobium sp.]|uniref:hypothetical protein n=1 Tax=Novosphingobium sp. TaxID=1874826 RepID=UPI001EB1CCA2|nr:hypothetical protein [Novosphingobium sp.]MBK9009414.1 hypothetical protein [Novosphingobium sp.]